MANVASKPITGRKNATTWFWWIGIIADIYYFDSEHKAWLNTIEFLLAKLKDGINIKWEKAMLLGHLLY